MFSSEQFKEHNVARILKFGGSSVGTPERIRKSIEIIKAAFYLTPSMAVVVSAFGGVTDHLIAMSKMALSGDTSYKKILVELGERHKNCACQLIQDELFETLKFIDEKFRQLDQLLEGICILKDFSLKTLDHIMSFGEILSAYIISKAIRSHLPSSFLDARTIIITDRSFGHAHVNFEATNKNIQDYFNKNHEVPIITGFIGSSPDGETTTLGRGGSDYSAAIVGAALNVNIIEIWTDVNGVMTADPRKEPYAFPIPRMSYQEAMEMSHFGAKVIHPPTIVPALKKRIPLLIKNSFIPESPGTFIGLESADNGAPICGISSIDDVVLLCIKGSGMVGVCGIAKRLFGALAEKSINIILISQGSSEHSICFAIAPVFVEAAKEAIHKEFSLEIQANLIDGLYIERDLSVIAVVGEKMCKTPGISSKLFGALGKNGINVIAIAQGSSELNISIVVGNKDESKALRAIHESFFLSPKTTLNLFLVGTGLIGTTLLQQIEKNATRLNQEYGLDIRLVGLANSRSMAFNPQGFALEHRDKVLEQSQEKMNIDHFVQKMIQLNLSNSAFVDCTSSQIVTHAYESILNANIAIVTPNKKANSGTYQDYVKLQALAAKKGVKFLYGSNVGAGLPIISTVQELIQSGDKILKIEAILSGTLSYLFNAFTRKSPFSEMVQKAQKNGYTEPDPREDLSGMDVMRKLLILARECGSSMEMDEIDIQPILPEDCFQASSVEEFYARLKNCDEKLANLLALAENEKKVLRYIASFEDGKGNISLQMVGSEHPFYHLSGTDNMIAIRSEFYSENPLVIKGQGAGAEVTAGKVFGDLIKLIN